MMVFLFLFSFMAHAETCRYSYTVWNAQTRRSEGPIHVTKPYAKLSPQEKGPFGCTPCERDQKEVILKNGLKFKACQFVATRFESILNASLNTGFLLRKVEAYRPSISKGKIDSRGRRTEFSHHAFGAALDVNEDQNGLYDHCVKWSGECRLIKGGPYRPGSPGSLIPQGPLVQMMKQEGFKWGGEIEGFQKDFMHFSSSGY